MYELSRVNVNLSEVPLSKFTRKVSYITLYVITNYALKFDARRQVKITRQSGNPPSGKSREI